jgi:hypothetical protein
MMNSIEKPKTPEKSALEIASEGICDIEGETARIPAGKIEYATGQTIYTDGNGHQFNRQTYIDTHKVDPEVVWQEVKRRRAAAGKKDNIRVI